MPDIAKDEAANTPRTTYLRDYRPPAYRVETIALRFELDPRDTLVTARSSVRREPGAAAGPLRLDGESLELVSLKLDGRPVAASEYELDETGLTLNQPPERFELEVVTRIHPDRNTALEGLYVSAGMFCTQCEAEGFRRITYFQDRPDVMARYTTTVLADKARYPVLLSNGNPVERGETAEGRHWVTWEDPFPKPSYLFALVAGDLSCHEDRFVTASGRSIALRIYVEPENRHKTEHAMHSLKQAMRWDEEVYGREYDLDIFMIVAVNDFNMGAMENKGLNIFNSSCVLASPDTATDDDYQNILGIVAHEYFHNWSGNRVTCRDWFQLSLKEGFTVFRDQEFSADALSRPVKRIHDVNLLRTHQFPQDAGPMAHAVRPDAYMEISNFYTVTVYNKGAEVVRMLATLAGPEGFRKGTDLYFDRHDGGAVTTEDFVAAIADANGLDLSQFKRWYDQAGTPELAVEDEYDAQAKRYTLRLRQHTPATPGQSDKQPFPIPVAMGLLDTQGRDLPLQLEGEPGPGGAATRVLELREREQAFCFVNVPERPFPSLLRGFTAPVKLDLVRSPEQLAFQLAHDSDGFNRWDAGQQLAVKLLLAAAETYRAGREMSVPSMLVEACASTLGATDQDAAVKAQILTLPSEAYLAEQCEVVDPTALHAAREHFRRELGERLWEAWREAYATHLAEGYEFDAEAVGRRRLKNLALAYMMAAEQAEAHDLCLQQYRDANNMSDRLAALSLLADREGTKREQALAEFYETWQDDAQVVEKWFAIQARADLPDALERVRGLMAHPAFSLTNPNKVRAVVGAFAQGNPVHFHAADGAGYAFLSEQVLALDKLNPQMAARLVQIFSRWRRFDTARRDRMRAELERIAGAPGISKDVYEIASKSLA